MRFSASLFLPVLAVLGVASCKPDDKKNIVEPAVQTTTVFVTNEGPFGNGSGIGTVSSFSKATGTVVTDVFQTANGAGRRLGNIVQSMAVANQRGYVVSNGSNKIEVVSLPDFKSVGTITGLSYPRYFLAVSATRGYVTQWGNFGSVRPGIKIVDLTTNTVVDSVATGTQPERLALVGGKVFVANSGANTVTVIDPATNRVASTVTVGDAPNSFAVDKNSRLWVLCGGRVAYNSTFTAIDYTLTTAGSLYRLDPGNPAMGASSRVFSTNRFSPVDLHINPAGDQLYFRAIDAFTYVGGVARVGIADATLPNLAAPLIPGLFYGLGVDPNNGTVYTGTGNFSADKMTRYDAAGVRIDEKTVGQGPNGFVFY